MKDISVFRLKLFACLALLSASSAMAADIASAGPQFNDKGELIRLEDYRGWVFLNSALGLTYGPNRPPAGAPQGVRPRVVEDELPLAVVLEVRGGRADELVSVVEGEVRRSPAGPFPDTAGALHRVEELPRKERRVGHAVERVPFVSGDRANLGEDVDFDHVGGFLVAPGLPVNRRAPSSRPRRRRSTARR